MRWGWGIIIGLAAATAVSTGSPPRARIAHEAAAALPAEAESACRGSVVSHRIKDVTSEMSEVGKGVKVTQLTSEGINFLTYHDVSAYSVATNRIVYNNMRAGVVMAGVDGSNAQVVAGPSTPVHLSFDGKFAVFAGPSSSRRAIDIYGVWLNKSGSCSKMPLMNIGFEMVPGQGPPKISLPVANGGGKEVIAFAHGSYLRRVLSDGTFLDPEPGFDPPDLDHGNPYHRIRLNPKFPQWILYSRNPGPGPVGAPENWLFNFETQQLCSVTPIGKHYAHDAWAPDGTKLGLGAGGPGTWNVATVFDSEGKVQGKCSGGEYGGFVIKTIGENVASHKAGLAANFCAWPPDDAPVFLCTSARRTGMKIFLLAMDGGGVKVLTSSDSHAGSDKGIPLAVFAQDSRHVLFRSDRSGTPQVYLVTGFTPSVP